MSAGSRIRRLVFQTSRKYHAPAAPTTSWKAGDAVSERSNDIGIDLPATYGFGIKQPVQVDDEIAHMRIVDSLLRLRLPGNISRSIVREYADDVDFVEVFKLVAAERSELTAEDEMQQLFACSGRLCGHRLIPGKTG